MATEKFNGVSKKQQLELRCNQIAGMVLVPKSSIIKHPSIRDIQTYGFDDLYVNKIAHDFAVSKQVIIHCLWELNIISKQFYFETEEQVCFLLKYFGKSDPFSYGNFYLQR